MSVFNAWIENAQALDTSPFARWFKLTATVEVDGRRQVVFERVLGWDDSQPPSWASARETGRVRLECEALGRGDFFALLDDEVRGAIAKSSSEVRRVELLAHDWLGGFASEKWGLQTPCVVYEVWAEQERYEVARAAWETLEPDEQEAVGLPDEEEHYVGSTIVLMPQVTSYLYDVHRLVVAGSRDRLEGTYLFSEVMDGPRVLSRSSGRVRLDGRTSVPAGEELAHLFVHFREPTLEALNQPVPRAGAGDALVRLPEDLHGVSGSDWQLRLVGPGGLATGAAVGLIRGFGDGYLTSEPWHQRGPNLGFSAPAGVVHIQPIEGAREAAFEHLKRSGGPFQLVDRYADQDSLAEFGPQLRGTCVLVGREGAERIAAGWARSVGCEVRVADRLHDRLLVGPGRAFLLGTSLNGLGKKHSFLVSLDSVMRHEIKAVFEALWTDAAPL